MTSPDDFIAFAKAAEPASSVVGSAWSILVVDDDPDVQEATRVVLAGEMVLGRALRLVFASSGQEARIALAAEPFALILLDVVMETDDAGLELVRHIRQRLGLALPRIILRTGQPGYAPELETIRAFDINDYKSKGEMTRTKLLTSVTSALRAYDQLATIEATRQGLEKIVDASASMLAADGLQGFASGVITQVACLIGAPSSGVVCAQLDALGAGLVIAAGGRFSAHIHQTIDSLDDAEVRALLADALAHGARLRGARGVCLYFGEHGGTRMAAYVESPTDLSSQDESLIEVLSVNLAACLRNIDLVERLRRQALVDPLTGLPNRAACLDGMRALIGSADNAVRLCLLDLDDFAAVNARYGHALGDGLLRAVAERLMPESPEATLTRVSADGFAVFGPAAKVEPAALRARLNQPLRVGGAELMLSASLGVVDLVSGAVPEDALKDAGIALKLAKTQHRGAVVTFDATMAAAAKRRSLILDGLARALDRRELFLHYQPQVSLATGQCLGVEALVRWAGPEGQGSSPSEFIPVAEDAGLMHQLGAWVLEEALAAYRRFADSGVALPMVAVNVSPAQFRMPGFAERVLGALYRNRLPPSVLEIEITESMIAQGEWAMGDDLALLRGEGVRVALDDFGTGYASLSVLGDMEIDRLKIDRGFVQRMDSLQGARIAALLMELGPILDCEILAEGVETEAQEAQLRSLGCTIAQGYRYSRPLAEAALVDWLHSRPSA